jgi:4-hydroxy-2-oxoheptanedioate aldolase
LSANHRSEPVSPWANPVTRALRAGKVCIGACSISFPCPAVAQISGQAGFNFYYFDMEHSHLPIEEVAPICSAAKLTGITPIAGTSGIADFLISRPLDNGAMGVIVPHVSTRAETELIVNACRYAPIGTRGLINFGHLSNFENADNAAWVEAMNREVLVAVKVESARGIENIEEIAATSGLDAILIGTGDLSATYGIPGQTNHPTVRQAIERTLTACERHHVAGGPHVSSAEAAHEWANRGARFMSLSFDGAMLLDASRAAANAARELLRDRML